MTEAATAGNGDGVTTVRVTGADETEAVLAGLHRVLAAARGEQPMIAAGPSDTAAVPVRGQGADLGTLFAELARDLLAQLDVQGTGLTHVRLDGLLRGDDGYVAWGYLEGAAADGGTAAVIDLAGEPVVERTTGGVTLSFGLRNG